MTTLIQNTQNNEIQVMTMAQLSGSETWTLGLFHQRPYPLFLWITRGQGLLNLHGERRGFGAHNAIFIPAGRLFSIDIGRNVIGHAVMFPMDDRISLPPNPQHLRTQDGVVQAELTALLELMRRERDAHKVFEDEALRAIANLVSIWLRRQMTVDVPTKQQSSAARLSEKFCDLLAQSTPDDRTMIDFATALDITPTHLARVCKSATGLSAADLISQTIQHQARSLLVHGGLPAKTIAQELGFGSAAYFTRFCQKHFGKTPRQIRKSANI